MANDSEPGDPSQLPSADAGAPDAGSEPIVGPVSYNEVRETLWLAGGERGRMTLEWLEPVVSRWEATAITATEVGELLLLGSDPGGPWDVLTNGTYRVRDADAPQQGETELSWDPTWSLIAVSDVESGERLLLDGNARALAVWWGHSAGTFPRDTRMRLLLGHLHPWVSRVCKPLSPLWR